MKDINRTKVSTVNSEERCKRALAADSAVQYKRASVTNSAAKRTREVKKNFAEDRRKTTTKRLSAEPVKRHTEKQGRTASDQGFIKGREARMEEARSLNLLSNVFMSVALNDKAACQYVLRILPGLPELMVREVRVQYRISKVISHDAILDVLAEDSEGRISNIEIQRADTIDHARRTRFYGAMIDSEYLAKGKDYDEMPEVHILYISETDLWEAGKVCYPVDKYFRGTGIPYEDGMHVLYVNAAVDDGSEVAGLMKYFKTADPADMAHGDLSKRVHYLKCEKGGEQVMCEMSDKWLREGIKIGERRGERRGMKRGEMKAKKETALKLAQKGIALNEVAEMLEVNESLAEQWVNSGSVTQPIM